MYEQDNEQISMNTFRTPSGFISGFWALPRPLTAHWGSGVIVERILEILKDGIDVYFGKQDQVEGYTIDKEPKVNPTLCCDWASIPLSDDSFKVGYWDPPYLGYIGEDKDVHYVRMSPSLKEICRVTSKRLYILSPLIYPCPKGWKRVITIAISYGPNKVIRALQGFDKVVSPTKPLESYSSADTAASNRNSNTKEDK